MSDATIAPPDGVVLVILPGATPTAATVGIATPSGKKIPIGVVDATAGTFAPTTESFMAWWGTLPTALPDGPDQPWNNGGTLCVS